MAIEPPLGFGDWLQQRRKALALTREQLAQRVGCSVSALRKLEAGDRRPSLQVAELLANALDLSPDERPTFLRVARGNLNVERLPAPAPRAAPAPQAVRAAPVDRLPVHSTPLIDRQRELDELGQLLSDPTCQLLTLVGPGGIGKTRLAIRAARLYGDYFADGAAFVPLAPLTSASFIVPAIAEALSFSFSGPSTPWTQLAHYLHDQHMLLVLDNVEHLLPDGAAVLADLRAQARAVTLLVTSREVLDLQAEWVFEVQGLPVPDALPAGEAAQANAIELFLQRARRAHVGFTPRPEDYPAILRICQLVDGIPLAIELAASWVRTLPCPEIAAELARDLGLLATAARDVPTRHRSMQATFDHSWKLLSAEEQCVLEQLSVFRGGFTREAAEQVAGASLRLLSSLASKSLVHRAKAGRYDLHELVREYAGARLAAAAEPCAAARQRHGAFFLALAEAAEPHLLGLQQAAWLDRLELDHDNLRAALQWSLPGEAEPSGDGGALALRLATALRWFWHVHGHFHEGSGWLARAVRQCPPAELTLRARALEAMAIMANPLGEHATSRALAEQSASLFRALGDRRGLADALTALGLALRWHGQAALSNARLTEALDLYRQIGDRWGVARNLYNLGAVRADHGGDVAGRAMLEESLAILEAEGDKYIHCGVVIALGIVACGEGDYPLARSRFERALDLGRELRQPWSIADASTNLGCVFRLQGDYTSAQANFETALAIYEERGSILWSADPLCALAENAMEQGDLETARTHLQEASARIGASVNLWLQVLVGYFSGRLAYHDGDAERAAAVLEGVVALARDNEFKPDLARSLIMLGRARLAQSNPGQATTLLHEGLALSRHMNHKLRAVTALEALADVAMDSHPEQAARWLASAQAARTALGAPLPPIDRPVSERLVAALQARLDERTLTRAYAEGQALSLEQAIADALQGAG